uniref:Uncharacterized protein n=1 Tax=Sander lucioperca TaxID=283035 RepID=A0A8D0A5Q7_SANLU
MRRALHQSQPLRRALHQSQPLRRALHQSQPLRRAFERRPLVTPLWKWPVNEASPDPSQLQLRRVWGQPG